MTTISFTIHWHAVFVAVAWMTLGAIVGAAALAYWLFKDYVPPKW